MCKVLEIARSTYYQSLHKTESNRDRENKALTNKIINIHTASKKRYGASKIHQLLQRENDKVSVKRVHV